MNDSNQLDPPLDPPSEEPSRESKGPLATIYSSGEAPHLKKQEGEDEEPVELGGRMTFLEHLDELRRRILYSLIAVFVVFLAVFYFREQIFEFLAQPVYQANGGRKLTYTKPTDPFVIYLKVSAVVAIFLSAPVILTQVWLFIAPGLYRREKLYFLPFLFGSTTLFVGGGGFAYYIVMEPSLTFLIQTMGAAFEPLITAMQFFDFEILIILGLGVMFQLPILVAFLSIFGLVTPDFLWRNFRYAILIIVTLAAVISPTTDPFMLILWSGPVVLLYVLSIGISWFFKRRRRKRKALESED